MTVAEQGFFLLGLLLGPVGVVLLTAFLLARDD
jgi:hypothetical protein